MSHPKPARLPLVRSHALLFLLCLGVSVGCSGKSEPPAEAETTDNDTGGGAGPAPGVTVIVADEAVNCDEDSECDDGNPCNGEETCTEGFCARGNAINCNDGIACTEDSCDRSSGDCINEPIDADQDGHAAASCVDADDNPLGDDCDDDDPNRFPGNIEVCSISLQGDSTTPIGDGIDEDCDPTTVGERDVDRDGYIDSVCFNVDDDGNVIAGLDCDDENASVSPLASEVCDRFDNNCDGRVDEGLTVTLFDDPDRDGFGGVADPDDPDGVLLEKREVCPGEVGVTDLTVDCGPTDRLISPDRPELCDGVDNDCDGEIDENVTPSVWYRDFDGDGWGNAEGGVKSTCERIDHLGWSLFLGDCDDGNPLVNPGQEEICDGLDNDCNPATTFLISVSDGEDDDGDGVPDPDCGLLRQDCNDSNSTIYPGAQELCDGLDNDCNGSKDTTTQVVKWYLDGDGDGFGANQDVIESCEPVANRVTKGGDCDDKNPRTHPGAPDDCSGQIGINDDCDGETDEGHTPVYSYRDLDGDGYGDEEVVSYCAPLSGTEYTSQGNDCDESNDAVNPGAAEDCSPSSNLDLDCDGASGCDDSECHSVAACEVLFGLQLESPNTNPMAAFVNQTIDVTVSLTDTSQSPIANQNVTVSGPVGTLFPTTTLQTSDPDGEVSFTIGVGMAAGPYVFTVRSGSTAPLSITVNAQYPPNGTVWSVVDRNEVTSSTAIESSFGPGGHIYYPRDIDVISDGSAYICGYYDVFHLDPVGQLSKVAGNGSGSLTGDGGPALSAGLSIPQWIAFDESANTLYVADTTVVRAVRFNTSPPTIHHAIGGGTGPIPGVAELADVGTITGLSMLENGHLLVGTYGGVLEYNPAPTSKRVSYYQGLITGEYSATQVAPQSYGVDLWQDGDKTVFWSEYLRGGDFGATSTRGIAATENGTSYRMAGRTTSNPNLEMVDGSHMDTSYIYTTLTSAVTDSAGNLIFSDNQSVFWKVDAVTHRASLFAGQYEAAARGAEYVHRDSAEFLGTGWSADIGPDGDLWMTEYASAGRVRRIRGGGLGQRSELNVDILSEDGQTYWPGQTVEPTVSEVMDGLGAPVLGSVVHQVPQAGWEAMAGRDASDIDGIAFVGGCANPLVGQYSLQSKLLDIDQKEVSADVLSYEVVRPDPGSVTTWMNVTHSNTSSPTGIDGHAALTTPVPNIQGFTVASDGSIYVSTTSYSSVVFRITPSGYIEIVAGGNGNEDSGDGLHALNAALYYPGELAVDEDNDLLYIVAGYTSDRRIRVVDLNTGIITAYAGHGASSGVGIAPEDRGPWYIHSMIIEDGVLYMVGPEGVETIDTTADEPTIEMLLPVVASSTDCNGSPILLYSASANSCRLAFAPDGKLYMHGYVCGTEVAGTYKYGPFEIFGDGSMGPLLSGDGNVLFEGPHDATTAEGTYSRGFAIDSSGTFYFTEYNRHWLRTMTPGGTISTVAGDPERTTGSDDFTSGLEAKFYYPVGVGVMPDDSLIIWDGNNRVLRRYWP